MSDLKINTPTPDCCSEEELLVRSRNQGVHVFVSNVEVFPDGTFTFGEDFSELTCES